MPKKSDVRAQKSDVTKDQPLTHRGLVAFASGAKLEIKPGEDLPTKLNVAPWGVHHTSKGRVVINETTARELPANQQRSNFDRVALDFNHNTVPDSESYRGEPAKIAAMGTPSVEPGAGIFLNDLDWTPEGREYVSGKHYIDLSPAPLLNAKGEVVLLHSAAVCRMGAIPKLSLFSPEKLPHKLTRLSADLYSTEQMDPYKQLLCELLGLDPEASTDDQIKTALSAFGSKVKAGSDSAAKVGAIEEKVNSLSASSLNAKDFETKLTALSTTLQEIQKRSDAAERADIIRQATLEGKAIPKAAMEGDAALSNTQLKALCAELAVTVPLERRTFTAPGAQQSGAIVANTAEKEVQERLGISDEQWKKFNA